MENLRFLQCEPFLVCFQNKCKILNVKKQKTLLRYDTNSGGWLFHLSRCALFLCFENSSAPCSNMFSLARLGKALRTLKMETQWYWPNLLKGIWKLHHPFSMCTEFPEKLTFYHYLPPCTCTCVYQGVRNVSFSENFGDTLDGWPQMHKWQSTVKTQSQSTNFATSGPFQVCLSMFLRIEINSENVGNRKKLQSSEKVHYCFPNITKKSSKWK